MMEGDTHSNSSSDGATNIAVAASCDKTMRFSHTTTVVEIPIEIPSTNQPRDSPDFSFSARSNGGDSITGDVKQTLTNSPHDKGSNPVLENTNPLAMDPLELKKDDGSPSRSTSAGSVKGGIRIERTAMSPPLDVGATASAFKQMGSNSSLSSMPEITSRGILSSAMASNINNPTATTKRSTSPSTLLAPDAKAGLISNSFSWRQVKSTSTSLNNPAHSSSTTHQQRQRFIAMMRSAYGLLADFKSTLRNDRLQSYLDSHLTALISEPDMISSVDFSSFSHSLSPRSAVVQSIMKSPRYDQARKQKLAMMTESRQEFESMSSSSLVEYCCQAQSCIVGLAQLLALSSSILMATSVTTSSESNNNNYRSNSESPQHSNQQQAPSSFTTNSTLRPRAIATDGPSPALFHMEPVAGSTPRGGLPDVTAANLAMSSMASNFFTQSVNAMHASTLMSVASQCLEPVHETMVANRTRDELGVKMLNNYLMLDTLGQGACGKVKLGYNVDKGQSVAIKVVRRSKTSNQFSNQSAASKVEALQREIAVMKKLRHKNIVSLYEVIDDPEAAKLYLVMQYVDDGPIAKMRPDGSCDTRPAEEVAMYARQVCAGLEYLHQKGIVHRDIKPENILVSSNKQAFLADFGVSEIFAGDQYTTKKHMGTPLFMAPELWRLSEELDHNRFMAESVRSHHSDIGLDGYALDIWALGVTFYMLLFGRPPYSDVSVLQRDVVAAPHFPEAASTSVPSEWLQLIRRMLDPKPYKRPQISVVRSAVKKIEKSIQRKASDHDQLASRSSFAVPDVVLEEVQTAITPRVTTPRASLTSPSASMRKSVALRSFLHAHNTIITGPSGSGDRRASLTQVPSQFTPFSPPIAVPSVYRTARYGSIKQGAETESPMLQSSLQSATAASTTLAYDELRLQTELCHEVPSSRRKTVEPNGGDSAGESMRDLLESSGPTRPLPPAYRPPHDGSPRVVGLRQASGSVQVVNAEASNKEMFEDAFGDDGSRRMSISNSQKRMTFTTSRGVSRPVIVVEDAEKFDVDSSS